MDTLTSPSSPTTSHSPVQEVVDAVRQSCRAYCRVVTGRVLVDADIPQRRAALQPAVQLLAQIRHALRHEDALPERKLRVRLRLVALAVSLAEGDTSGARKSVLLKT